MAGFTGLDSFPVNESERLRGGMGHVTPLTTVRTLQIARHAMAAPGGQPGIESMQRYAARLATTASSTGKPVAVTRKRPLLGVSTRPCCARYAIRSAEGGLPASISKRLRSEERRVGKEGRSWWSRYHETK